MSAEAVVARHIQATVDFNEVMHKASEANERTREAYLALQSFKAGMNEPPADLDAVYRQTIRAIGTMVAAQRDTHQLNQMMSRLHR